MNKNHDPKTGRFARAENTSPAGYKQCSTCKQEKSANEFYKNKRKLDGLDNLCKICRSQRSIEWRNKNLDSFRDTRFKSKFGISLEEYNFLLNKQAYACALCKNKCASGKNLAVDHCHKTGKVRGLLCYKCNVAVSIIGDNLEGAKRLVNYME